MMAVGPRATVLRDVSESLKSCLTTYIDGLREDAILFNSPAEVEAQKKLQLIVYLYQFRDNPFLKNLPPVLDKERDTHTYKAQAPPKAVDLLYMMVPVSTVPEAELILANQVASLFQEISVLDGDLLQGNLKETGNQRINIYSDDVSIDTLRHIWTGFPSKSYRLTLFYQLSPVYIPSIKTWKGELVQELELQVEPEEDVIVAREALASASEGDQQAAPGQE